MAATSYRVFHNYYFLNDSRDGFCFYDEGSGDLVKASLGTNLSWDGVSINASAASVTGPASSTNRGIAVFNGTSGAILLDGATASGDLQIGTGSYIDPVNNRLKIGNSTSTDFGSFYGSVNGANGLDVYNSNTGTSKVSRVYVHSAATSGADVWGSISAYPNNYTDTSLATRFVIEAGTSQSMLFKTDSGFVWTVGTTEQARLNGLQFGVGTTPTATIHARASTTASASYRATLGTAPTSPNDGDKWNDSTQKAWITFIAGIKQAFVGTIFTQTADQTVTNTVTETTILGTGVGTKTLPANFWNTGKTIRLRVGGIYSTPIGVASIVVKVKYGSTVIATVTTSSLLSGASSLEFDGEVLITCRTTGASGTVMVHGDIEYSTGVTGTIAVDPLNNAGATTTINTTTSNAFDVTVTWDSATTTRIAKSTVCTIEVLN